MADVPPEVSDIDASGRATSIFAEMLGLVCHPEYYSLGDQMVKINELSLTAKAFVVHISSDEASIYYAKFPQTYLRKVHREGIDDLTGTKQIYLHHTKPQKLFLAESRTKFIDDFMALILFLADGQGNVGFVRRDPEGPIHRDFTDGGTFSGPPQQVLDYDEEDDREYES